MTSKSNTSLVARVTGNGNGAEPGAPGPAPDAPRRHTGRPRGLPSGRAMVGGLLVAVAMVAAVALSRAGGAPPMVPTVVASTAISPSEALGPHNLTVTELALPEELIDSTYPDRDALAGTVSRSHIGVGEVLQRGGVVESTAVQREAAPAREVSLHIDGDRAVDGRLEAGDRVDVLATYGNGIDALTYVVLADAPVLSAARTDAGVSSGRALVLTLALSRRDDTISLAHAVDNADITVVRTTTAPIDDASMLHPFRPEPDPRADTGADAATEGR